VDILSDPEQSNAGNDNMARSTKASTTKPTPRVLEAVSRLKRAAGDRFAFDQAVTEIENASEITRADMIDIAENYAVPSKRPTTRKAAIAAIKKRFVELTRFAEKNKKASVTRPW
jgi:hypothetical protein